MNSIFRDLKTSIFEILSSSARRAGAITSLTLALAFVTLAACNSEAQHKSRESPYGLWSTGEGQTISVNRNGTYEYCDSGQCETGKHVPDGVTMVSLLRFGELNTTEHLRQLSGWDEFHQPSDGTSFSIGDGGMSEYEHFDHCQSRPCIVFGRQDYDVYRFVKLKDY